jgi:hypothetical protein
MKLLIAISGILICIGTASASSLAASSLAASPLAAGSLAAASRDAVVATDLSSRKITGQQVRKKVAATTKRMAARPILRGIAR